MRVELARKAAPECGSVSRPSVKACTTRSASLASSRAQRDQRPQVLERGVHAAVGDEPDQVHVARRRAKAARSTSLRGQRAVGDRVVDAHQILAHDRAGAEVQVADLAVAHLPFGQPHRAPAGRQRGVRVGRPQLVEDGRARRARSRCRARARRGPSRRAPPGSARRTGRPAALHAGVIARPRDDRGERLRLQRGAAHERAVDVRQRQQLGRVLGLDRAAVEDAHALGRAGVAVARPARG